MGWGNHTATIMEDWIYDGHGGNGAWIVFDLEKIESSLGGKQSNVRISLEITEIDTDGSESVHFSAREYGGNFKGDEERSVSYNEGLKVQLWTTTDNDGLIEYKFNYAWPEEKKVKVRLMLLNSMN